MLYRINIDHTGDGKADIVYEFRFETKVRNPNTFLYNTGPIATLDSTNFNRPQTLLGHRGARFANSDELGKNLLCPPCNVGPRSTPNYAGLANAAIYDLGDGIRVFAGQRLDGFYVDLGSVFDLAALRPFQNLHLIPTAGGRRRQCRCGRSTCTPSPSRCRSSGSPAAGRSRPT